MTDTKPKPKPFWELVCRSRPMLKEGCYEETSRMKIHTGWIVKVSMYENYKPVSVSLCHVTDIKHQWDLGNEM